MKKQKENILILRDIIGVIGGDTPLYLVDGDVDKVIVEGILFKDCLSRDLLMRYLEYEVFHLGVVEGTGQLEILIQEQIPS